MTIRVNHFTPEHLLGAPRRSAAVPSGDGKLALYTCSTYSFETHSRSNEVCVLNIASGQSEILSKDPSVSEPRWLNPDGHDIVWLKSGENGNTSLVVSSIGSPDNSYTAGTIAGPVSNLKVYHIKAGMVAIAVAGQANPDGSLFNPKDAAKPDSTARVYDSLFVRHWDTFITKERNSIFTGLLQASTTSKTDEQDRFNLVGFTNALKGTGLECPIPPFGGTDQFDIGRKGLVIVAKDPDLDPATHTKCNAYFIPREDFTDMNAVTPLLINSTGFNGAATSPVFSSDGSSLAYLHMKEDGYESDKNFVLVIPQLDAQQANQGVDMMKRTSSPEDWDRSPTGITWSHDDKTLYLQAEKEGRGCLFSYSLDSTSEPNPKQLTDSEYVAAVHKLSPADDDKHLLISTSSLVDNSAYAILHTQHPFSSSLISSSSNSGSLFGLSSKQVSSLWWKGDHDRPIHAWQMVPSWFRPDHKYPLAFLVHGGPQGAWNDQWSTRWNPAVFAEQGYVVICPNPTGSTGYGQAFVDAIQKNWGGSPYIDLEKGFEYISTELSYVDTSRAVALGASYGGYMMNWIQGQPLAGKFQTLVCHDGVFSMTGQLASEEQYFPAHDLGGHPWDSPTVRALYDKWDPSRQTHKWNTPMLIIHNSLDYRLTISEGLSAFNVLQCKGVESRFVSFPDENHWVIKPENSLVWHLLVLNWINRFVGLPKVVDREGRDGEEYLRQGRR